MIRPTQGKKLLEQMHDQIRVKQYSFSTEKTYLHWTRAYFLYHNPELKQGKVAKHPKGRISALCRNCWVTRMLKPP
jgi:hypothetical protein